MNTDKNYQGKLQAHRPYYKLEDDVWETFEAYRRQYGNLAAVRLARHLLEGSETMLQTGGQA